MGVAREMLTQLRDRVKELNEAESWYKAGNADESLGEAYLALAMLKNEMDSWGEVYPEAQTVYSQILKAMDSVAAARQETTQLREMIKKFLAQVQ